MMQVVPLVVEMVAGQSVAEVRHEVELVGGCRAVVRPVVPVGLRGVNVMF